MFSQKTCQKNALSATGFLVCFLFPCSLSISSSLVKEKSRKEEIFFTLKKKTERMFFFSPRNVNFPTEKQFFMNNTSQFLPLSAFMTTDVALIMTSLSTVTPCHTIPHHIIPYQLTNPQPRVLTWIKFSLEDKLPGLPLCLLASVLPDETSLCLSPTREDPQAGQTLAIFPSLIFLGLHRNVYIKSILIGH